MDDETKDFLSSLSLDREVEQAMSMADTTALILGYFYKSARKNGFTEDQAMMLVLKMLEMMGRNNGQRPNGSPDRE
jgi:hypothetical protein